MRVKQIPADFIVQEQLDLDHKCRGSHEIFRGVKPDIARLQIQTRMAAALGYARSTILFSAPKDRQSVGIEFASNKGNLPSPVLGLEWQAERASWLDRPLCPTGIAGKHFSHSLRDLQTKQTRSLILRGKWLRAVGFRLARGRCATLLVQLCQQDNPNELKGQNDRRE